MKSETMKKLDNPSKSTLLRPIKIQQTVAIESILAVTTLNYSLSVARIDISGCSFQEFR